MVHFHINTYRKKKNDCILPLTLAIVVIRSKMGLNYVCAIFLFFFLSETETIVIKEVHHVSSDQFTRHI